MFKGVQPHDLYLHWLIVNIVAICYLYHVYYLQTLLLHCILLLLLEAGKPTLTGHWLVQLMQSNIKCLKQDGGKVDCYSQRPPSSFW